MPGTLPLRGPHPRKMPSISGDLGPGFTRVEGEGMTENHDGGGGAVDFRGSGGALVVDYE
jgi:hypothetical protein